MTFMPIALSRRSWPRHAFWSLAAVALLATLVPRFLADIRPDRPRDFVQEWASARNYRDGRPIYERQEISVKRLLGIEYRPSGPLLTINAHPPTSVLLAIPLAGLDYRGAFLAWTLISLAAFGLSLAIVCRTLSVPRSPSVWLPLTALMLVCNPLMNHLAEGQLGLVILLLVVGCWAADRSGRPVLAGVCLGTAVAIKLFPALLLLYFILGRRWRVAGSAMVTVAALTAITAAILGLECYRDYVFVVMPTLGQWRSAWSNLSFNGFWSRLFDPFPLALSMPIEGFVRSPIAARVGTILCDLALIGAIVPAIIRARSAAERDVAFALCCIAIPLVAPIAWVHYLTLMLLPLVVLGKNLPESGGPSRWAFRILVAALWLNPNLYRKLLALIGPEADVNAIVATPLISLLVLSIPTYAIVGLFVLTRMTPARSDRDSVGAIPAPVSMRHQSRETARV